MWFQKPPLGTPLDWGNPLNKGTAMALAMNEGHGDKVQDLSLNGNHGTLENFAFPPSVDSGWNPGQTGIGLKSDGADDHIDCGDNESLKIRDAVTVSALVCLDNGNDWAGIVGKGASTGSGYRTIIQAATHKPYFDIKTSGGISSVTSSVAATVGRWHNVVGVYDKGGGTNNLGIFVDGVGSFASWTGTINDTASHMFVGRQGAVYLNGFIDQPRIMNRPWSAKEVRDYAINPWQVYLDE